MLTCYVMLLVIITKRYRMQSTCRPPFVPAFFIVVASSIGLFAKEMYFLPAVQIPEQQITVLERTDLDKETRE